MDKCAVLGQDTIPWICVVAVHRDSRWRESFYGRETWKTDRSDRVNRTVRSLKVKENGEEAFLCLSMHWSGNI